jgi:hypothetical protein
MIGGPPPVVRATQGLAIRLRNATRLTAGAKFAGQCTNPVAEEHCFIILKSNGIFAQRCLGIEVSSRQD